MTADNPLDTLKRHRLELDRLTALLATVINYLETDLETSRLEGRRLDANTRELAELVSRVSAIEERLERVAWSGDYGAIVARVGELERRGDNHLTYLDSLQAKLDELGAPVAGDGNAAHSKAVR